MKYIIKESKLLEIAYKWLVKNFSKDQLELVHDFKKNRDFFVKNGEIILLVIPNERVVYNKYLIGYELSNMFGLDYTNEKLVIKRWISDEFGINNTKSYRGDMEVYDLENL